MKYVIFSFISILTLFGCSSSPSVESEKEDHTESLEFGTTQLHKKKHANEYSWLSYVPNSIDKNKHVIIVITGVNGNIITNDYEDTVTETQNVFSSNTDNLKIDNIAYLCPIIPRTEDPYAYSVSLNRDTMIGSAVNSSRRADLKVIKIIDTFANSLINSGLKPEKKIIIEGFSAGAMFAQRFALLHPDYVYAVVAGSPGGCLTMPLSEVDGIKLNWPLGINDFEKITGETFRIDEYRDVYQYIYIGSADRSNSTVRIGNNDIYTDNQIKLIFKLFGIEDPERLQKQVEISSGTFPRIHFMLYPGMRHTKNNQVKKDIEAYLNNLIKLYD